VIGATRMRVRTCWDRQWISSRGASPDTCGDVTGRCERTDLVEMASSWRWGKSLSCLLVLCEASDSLAVISAIIARTGARSAAE
jgi:hypothetical protein